MVRISKIAAIVVIALILIPLAVVAGDTTTSSSAKKVDKPSASNSVPGHLAYTPSSGYMWIPESNFEISESEWAPWDPWWAFPNTWYYGDNSWNWRPLIPTWSMSPLGWGYDSWYGGWYGYSPYGYPLGIPEYVGSTLFQDTQYAKGLRFTHRNKKKVEATTRKKSSAVSEEKVRPVAEKKSPAVSEEKVKAVAKKKAPAASRKSARIDEIKNELKIKDRSDPGSYGMPNNQGRNIQSNSTVKNPTVKKRHGKNEPSIGSGSSKIRPPKVKRYYPPGNSGGTVVTPPPAPPRTYRRRHKSN